jgi:chromosome partitioning protein
MTLAAWADFSDRLDEADARVREEHPSVVLRDLAGRRLPHGHVITFANEKGGVGKSTLAFHTAVSLSHQGLKVLVVDCDRRQQSIHRLLEARDATARTLKVELPRPRHFALERPSGAILCQEIDRVAPDADVVVIDLAGHDSPIARRGIALADTVVTPVNCSHADLDPIGRMNPVSHKFKAAGPFSEVVGELREQRVAMGIEPFDWVVIKNRMRNCEQRLIASVDQSLATMAGHLGFRLARGLTERLAYRDLLPFGLSHVDLKLIPQLGQLRSAQVREMRQLMDDLQLPEFAAGEHRKPAKAAPVLAECERNYRDSLYAATSAAAAG